MAAIVAARVAEIRNGNFGVAEAFRQGVKTVESLNAYSTGDDKGRLLQLLADLMANAAAAYYDMTQGGETPPDSLIGLIREAEAAMRTITADTTITKVAEALGTKQGAQVKLAVNNLVGTPTNKGTLNASPWNVKPPTVAPVAGVEPATHVGPGRRRGALRQAQGPERSRGAGAHDGPLSGRPPLSGELAVEPPPGLE